MSVKPTRRMLWRIVQFLRREDGPTAVEYAVLLALIVLVSLASIRALGPAVLSAFQSSSSTVGTYGVP